MTINDQTGTTRAGTSLVEALVVIGIIGIVVAMLVPAVQRIREAASSADCRNNLRQLALGIHHYESAMGRVPNNQWGPPSFGTGPNSRAWSWLARVLPFVEQENLYSKGQIPDTTLVQSGIIDAQIALLLCPSDSVQGPRTDAGNLSGVPVGQTNYKGVSGANWGDRLNGNPFPTDWRNIGTNGSYNGQDLGDGIFFRGDYRRPLRLNAIGDGTSNTFMVGEDLPALNRWCSWPYANNANNTCAIPPNRTDYPPWEWENTDGFRSRHPGGVHFAYADASVHFVGDAINLEIYRAMATINGGEAATVPD